MLIEYIYFTLNQVQPYSLELSQKIVDVYTEGVRRNVKSLNNFELLIVSCENESNNIGKLVRLPPNAELSKHQPN